MHLVKSIHYGAGSSLPPGSHTAPIGVMDLLRSGTLHLSRQLSKSKAMDTQVWLGSDVKSEYSPQPAQPAPWPLLPTGAGLSCSGIADALS